MTDEIIDAGFDAVEAGEVWVAPEVAPGNLDRGTAVILDVPHPFVPLQEEVTKLTPEGVDAAKILVQLPAIDWPVLAKLAREFAMNIKPRDMILKEFGLNDTQYDFLAANNDYYIQSLKAASNEWNSPLSTRERIAIEAAAILEDSLVGLGARMQSRNEGLPGVIEAAKLFAKVAGVGERQDGPASSGERFVINIDLGAGRSITARAEPPAAVPAPAQVYALTSGEGDGS